MPAAQLAPQTAFQSRPVGGGHARFRRARALRLPVGDLSAIRVFGLLGEFEFSPADVLERVVGGLAFLAAAGGHPGAELERAELLLSQRLAGERVVPPRSIIVQHRHASLRAVATIAICTPRRARTARRTRAAARGSLPR